MAFNPNNPNGQATSANSAPVVLASDQSAVPVSAASLPLPSGAATAALQTQPGVDIGDVTINNASGASAVNIQDGGNSITVDGTVTANLSATDNAVLDAIEVDTTTIAGAVSGTEMQVDIVTMPAVDTELTTDDLDTGAGTDTRAVVGLVGSKSGGGELIPGSATDGLLVNLGANNDITGTVTANLAAGTNNIGDVDVLSIAAGDNNIGNVDIVTVPAPLSTTGGGTEATALRVTIANDSTGVVSIDDNAGSLTVDGTVTANLSATDNAVLDTIASPVATISATPLQRVAIFDASDAQITSFGGGTQYTEDDAAAANPIGTSMMLVREDARAGGLTTTDGDNVAARGNNKGELYVKTTDSDALLTTIDADTSTIAGAVAGSEMQVDIVSSATLTVNSHDVTNAGAFVVQENGAALTALQLIDDAVYTDDTSTHSTGASKGYGIMAAAAPTDGSVDANDIGMVAMTTDRKLHVSVQDSIPAGTNAIGKLAANSGVDIGDVDVTSVVAGTGATNLGKAEDAAHSSGDTGIFALSVRNDTPNATVAANGDYQQISSDSVGGVRTALYETDFAVLGTNHVKKYYTNAGAVTDGIIWSPAAGKRWYVTDIFINVSAAATVTLEDDLAGGDSPVWKAELAANSGWSHRFGTPLFSGEDAADLLITTSAGNVYVTVTGYEV